MNLKKIDRYITEIPDFSHSDISVCESCSELNHVKIYNLYVKGQYSLQISLDGLLVLCLKYWAPFKIYVNYCNNMLSNR